jgi:hypothetical protein
MSVIVQVVIVEHTVQTGMVNIFFSNNYETIYFSRLFFLKMLIYVRKLFVKTMELVLFEL